MKTVRLQIGSREKLIVHHNVLFEKEPNIVIINPYNEEDEESFRYPTLQDLAIIMYSMMGQGVGWQLAYELSNRLNIKNPALIANVIYEMCKEYYEMSEEEAKKRTEDAPSLYDPHGSWQ